jgi:hypothetical protein
MATDLIQNEGRFESDLDFLLHFQNVLLQAVEGNRYEQLDAEYRSLRSTLLDAEKYEDVVPSFVRRHRDLHSLWPTLKSFNGSWEPRRVEVRRQFEPAFEEAERTERPIESNPNFDASAWTGATKPAARLAAVKTLLPVAQAAIERLIEKLDEPRHNGGPPLDTTVEALEALRSLHSMLGEILQAADEGKLDHAYSEGMAQEAARYAKRAAKQLRDDPIPYAMAALLLAVLSACGFPGVGGFLGSVALKVQRK